MYDNIRADLQHFRRSSGPLTTLEVLKLAIHSFGFQALMVYRLGRWLRDRAQTATGWPWRLLLPISRLSSRCIGKIYGIYLDPDSQIGAGFYIGHIGGIHVTNCRLGAGCSIHQRVRIGPAKGGETGPVIGDRVWIGGHATIQGAFRVGDGATVGAGAVVMRDVAERALVVGSPARVIRRQYDNTAIL